MFAVITALFFASAAAFAVFSISRAFAGSVERFDELFAQYRALDSGRTATGRMQPVVRFTPAPAPDFSPRTVVALSARNASASQAVSRINRVDWRAAA
jgi:hypothetical protein